MEAIQVEARRVSPAPLDLEADIARAEKIARMMDAQFQFGGIRYGLDAFIGLVPVAGDLVSTAIGLYPIYIARRHKLGKVVVGRMLANLGIDFIAGAVPLIGDAVDVFVKANLKNVALLKAAAAKRRR